MLFRQPERELRLQGAFNMQVQFRLGEPLQVS